MRLILFLFPLSVIFVGGFAQEAVRRISVTWAKEGASQPRLNLYIPFQAATAICLASGVVNNRKIYFNG